MENKKEWVLHIDGDAFFASVEQSRRPELWGKAVVVGAERGMATALSYAAKAIGVERGMPIFKIKKEYKNVTVLSSHFELYNKYAHSLANILRDEVDILETYSIDECFATITCPESELKKRIKDLKKMIQSKLGVTYSFGISTTKVLAKVASKRNKPDGLCFLIVQDEIDKALITTKVENIWGLGFATYEKLNSYKIKTAWEFVHKVWPQQLQNMLSKNIFEIKKELSGEKILEVDNDSVHKKSIQSTRTFINKTSDKKIINSELSKNLETAVNDLVKNNLYTNRVLFYVKMQIGTHAEYKKSKIISHESNLPFFTQSCANMSRGVSEFIEQMFAKAERADSVVYKSSGIILTNLKSEDEIPISLFGDQVNALIEENKSVSLVNNIRNKYGFGIIGLASSLNAKHNRENEQDNRDMKDNYEYGLPYKFLGVIKCFR